MRMFEKYIRRIIEKKNSEKLYFETVIIIFLDKREINRNARVTDNECIQTIDVFTSACNINPAPERNE